MASPLDTAQLGLSIASCMADLTMMAAGAYDGKMACHAVEGISNFAHLMARTEAGTMLANQGNPVLSPLVQALRR